ncbi:hypothetical protein, partial [Photorhabdus australis]|uniref:hypothetical protein n=1 Tax=Photorhabdus australis TaxID=286156 RepID=UPI0013F4F8C9
MCDVACTGDVVVDKEPDTCCSRWQATALGTRRISTLRLAARPAAVEWVAIGRVTPSPMTTLHNDGHSTTATPDRIALTDHILHCSGPPRGGSSRVMPSKRALS